MKWIVSRFHNPPQAIQPVDYIYEYAPKEDVIIYDRSDEPVKGSIEVPNIGTDIADKFQFIIDNYDNLPEIAVYTKANLFKYCPKEEFDELYKNAKDFTPLLTQKHRTYEQNGVQVCFYSNGMYFELNNRWYLNSHPMRDNYYTHQIEQMIGTYGKQYVPFAPGSNYILTRENIRQNPKNFYEDLRKYLMWTVYPGEAQLIERGLYEIFRPK